MGRPARPLGDKVVISALDDSSPISYDLAEVQQNVSYETVSAQPEVEPNQPLSVPLSFHGGLSYSSYNERTAGFLINDGMLTQEPNIIRPPIAPTTVTLTDAAAPPMYFLETPGTASTIAYDASSEGATSGGTTNTLTVSHTVASGDDRILIVGVSENFNGTTVSATFGGVALTHLAKKGAAVRQVDLLYLLSPAVSTADVVVTTTDLTRFVVGVSSYTGVDQDTPFGAKGSATGNDTTPTVTITSVSGELVVDVLASLNTSAATAGASQTRRWHALSDTNIRGAGSEEAGAASVTMSWTITSDNWVILAAALKANVGPRLYAISVEPGEVNVYKISLESGDFGTLLNTRTFTVITTQPMGHPAEWNDGTNTYWRLGLGDNGLIQNLETIASGSSNDTWEPEDSAGAGDADARHLVVFGNRLMRSTNENQVSVLPRATNPQTESQWGSDFFVGDVGRGITELGEASGLSFQAAVNGLFEWDTIGQPQNVFPAIGNAARNGQGMKYWHGGFLIPTDSGLWWTLTGEPVGPDSNPNNRANDPSLGSTTYFKHGRWMGLAEFGAYVYGLYVDSSGTTAYLVQGRERDDTDPPGWGPIIWHVLDRSTADFNNFHGCFITELSRFSATEARPCLWYAHGNDLRYIFLDKDGAPLSRRGDIDLDTEGFVISGRIDFGLPRVTKQLHVIEGWAEDFGTVVGTWLLRVYRDGGTVETVGTITESDGDGFFQRFWTQDTNDTARAILLNVTWAGSSSLTDTNGPHLRDVTMRAVAAPNVEQNWRFLFATEDDTVKTAKKLRSELEGYRSDLKKFKLPDGDVFNGVMGKTRMLRADEIRDLGEGAPKYIIEGIIREMST